MLLGSSLNTIVSPGVSSSKSWICRQAELNPTPFSARQNPLPDILLNKASNFEYWKIASLNCTENYFRSYIIIIHLIVPENKCCLLLDGQKR